MDKKNVRFEHYQVRFLSDDERTDAVADLHSLLSDIAATPFRPSARVIDGDTYRFHICRYHEREGLWEIQILHLRDKILPGIADRESAYELLEIPEGKYAAESCTIMYDVARHILYMQRNVYCMSPDRLMDYLSMLLPEGTRAILSPVMIADSMARFNESTRIRKVILAANTEELQQMAAGGRLRDLLAASSRYQGTVVKIEISMGRRRGILHQKDTLALIGEAYREHAMERLDVYMANEDAEFCMYDLLKDKAVYHAVMPYSRSNPITHDRLFAACLEEYRREHGL